MKVDIIKLIEEGKGEKMDKEDILTFSEESRAIRLYIDLHPNVFVPSLKVEYSVYEILVITHILNLDIATDREKIAHKVFDARMEAIFRRLERNGLARRLEDKGEIAYELSDEGIAYLNRVANGEI